MTDDYLAACVTQASAASFMLSCSPVTESRRFLVDEAPAVLIQWCAFSFNRPGTCRFQSLQFPWCRAPRCRRRRKRSCSVSQADGRWSETACREPRRDQDNISMIPLSTLFPCRLLSLPVPCAIALLACWRLASVSAGDEKDMYKRLCAGYVVKRCFRMNQQQSRRLHGKVSKWHHQKRLRLQLCVSDPLS